MDDHPNVERSTSVPCKHCGYEPAENDSDATRAKTPTYQVIVACASCGHPFAALSRN